MNEPNRTAISDPDGMESVIVQSVAIEQPEWIGRYRVEKLLGEGGYGRVYLARDEQLNRPVAIKVPHFRFVAETCDAESYLIEARTVANLDHPNILPVYDVGSSEQFPCYAVSKYVDGADLGTRIKQSRLWLREAVEVVATVAEALQYAHRHGLVHRDIKPSNILLDKSGKPFVGDFGLALREQDIGKGPRHAGTPAYMSPEQARGEGHRVDGRSDIFSLGIVFYELLVGRRPFRAESQEMLLEQIKSAEAKPPRHIDDKIPKELERICLKSLSKRAADRYTVAADMADDLRHWLRPLNDAGHAAGIGLRAADLGDSDLPPAPGLVKDSFVSYATPDKDAAYRLCRLLEEQHIGCWIAPRDVPPGADYGEAIIRAIEGTTSMVLLLSAHANASIHVAHEVERATSKRKRVIPVRLEDVPPSPSLELHLATAQSVDAWRIPSAQLSAQLAAAVRGDGSQPLTPAPPSDGSPRTPITDSQPLKIVPKGLRSYDARDADFFLELLPGPRDRDGLPDSLRFWKTRIEEKDPDHTFFVGLIYGPSGCGKSSLVKAGLLPRLSDDVLAVYVEATPDDTESRLLNGLRKCCPSLPSDLGLKETLAGLRRGQGVPAGKKVLIVVDQFEQWLHANREKHDSEFVQAVRQCDGGRVQCIVMVRDDFWMAATRFMRELEIRLVEGGNSAAVDLFDVSHAKRVLAAFGRAFGRIPEKLSETSKDQKQFLERSVSGLAQEGKVVCVRMALFAEMMKGKAWTQSSLKEAGGTEGVGITFLEETFHAATAPPEHRYQQKAARSVLKALLPESGSDFKGHMRPYSDLLEASGHAEHPEEFDNLLRILDGETRLITPTDPEGVEAECQQPPSRAGKYFQLTHDYLVPSLREWLARKQKETRRGRAELLLADRAAPWNSKPENRLLPSTSEYLRIRLLTRAANRSEPERKMLAAAGRVRGLRALLLIAGLVVVTAVGLRVRQNVLDGQHATQSQEIVNGLLQADVAKAPEIVKSLDKYRRWADPLLKAKFDASAESSTERLHAALGLVASDPSVVDFLRARLLSATPRQFVVIRDSLRPYRTTVIEPLWNAAIDPKREEHQRFQAACALATFAPGDDRWSQIAKWVAEELAATTISDFAVWRDALRGAKPHLIAPLSLVYSSAAEREPTRAAAAGALAGYLRDRPGELFKLLSVAEPFQFETMLAALDPHFREAVPLAEAELAAAPSWRATEAEKEAAAKRQVNAAVALIRWKSPDKVWPLLRRAADPRARSYLIQAADTLGVDPQSIIGRWEQEPDPTARAALAQMLAEFSPLRLPIADRPALIKQLKLRQELETNPDPGLHSSLEWLFSRWNQADQLKAVRAKLQTAASPNSAASPSGQRRWYVNSQGQTFSIIDAGDFNMGSPETESGRAKDETRHAVKIGRRIAVATTLVSRGQYRKFQTAAKLAAKLADEPSLAEIAPTDDCPQTAVQWYEAAHYCNWLSDQEGLAECYEPNPKGEFGPGMKAREKHLDLPGYRLPTEAEWEFACRAGTTTSRYYGSSPSLLPRYAHFSGNGDGHTCPVTTLRPNDLGLFDMHGNAWQWCDDAYRTDLHGVAVDSGDDKMVVDTDFAVLRGGSFDAAARYVRSSARLFNRLPIRLNSYGFRPVRTLGPLPPRERP